MSSQHVFSSPRPSEVKDDTASDTVSERRSNLSTLVIF